MSRRPLSEEAIADIFLPAWLALDRMATRVYPRQDAEPLFRIIQICLVLREHGVNVAVTQLTLMNTAARALEQLQAHPLSAVAPCDDETRILISSMLDMAMSLCQTVPEIIMNSALEVMCRIGRASGKD